MSDEKSTEPVEDQELNDLLDSALKDFDKKLTPTPDKKDDLESGKSEATPIAPETPGEDPMLEEWTFEYIMQAHEKNIQRFMQLGSEEDLGASLQEMVKSIADSIPKTENTSENSAAQDFQSAISKALGDLTATTENIQNDGDLSELLSQTSLEDGAGGIVPFMEGMLHCLFSKDIFYPPLKENLDKYPEWLEEHKDSLSPEDLARYTKQLEILRKVCTEFENEKDDDTQEIKKKRVERIVALMEEAQGCGPLPEELVGEQTNPFQLGDSDIENLIPGFMRGADAPQNCSVM